MLSSTAALSQPSGASGRATRADALFVRAVALRKQGRLDKACPLFERSQALDPARGTLLNIARCGSADNRLLDARNSYRRLLRESAAAGDRERLVIAQRELADVERRLPQLKIELSSRGKRRTRMAVRVDGTLIAAETLGMAVPVDPGRHMVRVTSPGYQTWTYTFAAVAGLRYAATVPALQRVVARAPSAFTTRRIWALAGAGTAVVGVGLGAYFGLRARSKWSDSSEFCTADHSSCTELGRELVGQASDAASRSNIAFGVGAIAAVTAGVLWLTGSPRTAAEPSSVATRLWRVRPTLGAGHTGVTLFARFD